MNRLSSLSRVAQAKAIMATATLSIIVDGNGLDGPPKDGQ
jgi:hypothetical protein